MSTAKTIYQIKVMLLDAKPPIWRRFLVPNTTTLDRLHGTLQAVMGWQDYHLHMFTIDEQSYGDPEDDEYGELGTKNEARLKLNQLVPGEGFKFHYEYDFGDSWEHQLVVEKILPVEPGLRYPLCTAGKRHCPPEDVGGIGGYYRFLEATADPQHPEHDEYLVWIGGEFDPEYFNLEEVNDRLHHARRSRETEEEYDRPPQLDQRVLERIISWAQGLSETHAALTEPLAVRRDMATLLLYFKEKHPFGTQSTGNLQLKAVREVCAQFTNPLKLEGAIGDYHYQIRSEADVWPLFYLHRLAVTGGLVTGGQARTWRLTSAGDEFLNYSTPVQLVVILSIWWYLENWTIAFPFEGLSHGLPRDFRKAILARLLELKVGRSVLYERFADDLILSTGLTWSSADQTFARSTLRTAIERMVIERLAEFGCLECEYRTRTRSDFMSKDLIEVRLTPLGKGILEIL
jgi:hypothetical protein